METMQDLASFYTWFQELHGLEGVRAIGFSMGGWLAAEIAANCRHAFSKLLLVGAVGIKPQEGEITDIFIITPSQVADLSLHDPKQVSEYRQIYPEHPTPDETDIAERDREMAVRLCWKPYMHDPRLPYLLERVSIPTAIVWGQQDRIVPVECAELYHQAIKGSQLEIIDNCGHSPQIEKPDEFLRIALDLFS
jgi:pimeloyl-ACP methyl ester carboxylesterase